MLKIENFSKTFDENFVLKNVSFELGFQEFVVILGPSGSGKTTLLRMINGLVPRDKGSLYFKGEAISDAKRLTELRRHFGMIFQHYNLVENLRVINNVLTGALTETDHFRSLLYIFPRKLKLEALRCLERVQLLDKAYERTDNLSGGQKQRVGIARAIMQKPAIILADEPIANLDPLIAYNIMKLLKDICITNHISVICNLHQVDFALQFADRIICLVDGEIILDKPVSALSSETIYQAYKGRNRGMFFEMEN
ncbi:phosphonate ABC transporter ATP-binding protein [Deltaproteobacteria bacterium TL4]